MEIGLKERLKIAMDAKFFCPVARMLTDADVPPEMEWFTPEGAAYWIAVEVLELPAESFAVPMKKIDNPWIDHKVELEF